MVKLKNFLQFMAVYGSSWDFYGIFMGFHEVLMGFHRCLMGFHGIFMGFHEVFMGSLLKAGCFFVLSNTAQQQNNAKPGTSRFSQCDCQVVYGCSMPSIMVNLWLIYG